MTIKLVRECEKSICPPPWRHPLAWSDYLVNHKQRKKNINRGGRLIMTMVVRNEADIIEANIRFHAAQGVDTFLIIDHASTDNTVEILEALRSDFDIVLQKKGQVPWDQATWVTEACHFAKKKLKADIIINNDADEFWLPDNENHSIKERLKSKHSVFQVERYNVLPTAQQAIRGEFWNFEWYVKRPVGFTLSPNESLGFKHQEAREILYRQAVKVAIKPHGFLSVNRGSHAAVHVGARKIRFADGLSIYHYPIRNMENFVSRMKLRDEYLTDPKKEMGQHNRKWLNEYRAGKHMEQFQRVCIDDDLLEKLKDLGIAVRNERLKTLLSKACKVNQNESTSSGCS